MVPQKSKKKQKKQKKNKKQWYVWYTIPSNSPPKPPRVLVVWWYTYGMVLKKTDRGGNHRSRRQVRSAMISRIRRSAMPSNMVMLKGAVPCAMEIQAQRTPEDSNLKTPSP